MKRRRAGRILNVDVCFLLLVTWSQTFQLQQGPQRCSWSVLSAAAGGKQARSLEGSRPARPCRFPGRGCELGGAGQEGTWVSLPDQAVCVMAFCYFFLHRGELLSLRDIEHLHKKPKSDKETRLATAMVRNLANFLLCLCRSGGVFVFCRRRVVMGLCL